MYGHMEYVEGTTHSGKGSIDEWTHPAQRMAVAHQPDRLAHGGRVTPCSWPVGGLANGSSRGPGCCCDDANRANVVDLEFTEFSDGELVVEVDLPRFGIATLSLYPHSLRSDQFQLLVDDGTSLVQHPAPPVRTRKGEVLEIPGSRVRGSFHDGRLTAIVLAGDQVWSITPTVDLGFPGSGSWHGIVEAVDG